MTQCAPYGWIGSPLLAISPNAQGIPLPDGMDDLHVRLDADLSLRTFSRDLAASIPTLRRHARSLSRDADAIDDLVQDTLLRAWKARDQFVAGTSLRAWACTILRNVFLNQRRRARFHGEYDETAAEIRLARPEAQSAVVELGDVRRAMERLGDDQRRALTLVAVDGLSYEEAARRTGIPLASFKSRVSRARAALHAIIDGPAEGRGSAAAASAAAAAVPAALVPDRRDRRAAAAIGDGRGGWMAAKEAGRPLWIG